MEIKDLFKNLTSRFHEHVEKNLRRSLFLQDRTVRKLRVEAIISLSIEYDKARKQSVFSSAFAHGVIENMIIGDWKEVRALAELLRFNDESDDIRLAYAPIWEMFVGLAMVYADKFEHMENGVVGVAN